MTETNTPLFNDRSDESPSEAISFLRNMVSALPHGEHRPQQEEAVTVIEQAITNNEHALVQAGTGTGKMLDDNTLIPTPAGMTTMGELQVGDEVLDETGTPCTVTAKYAHKAIPVAYKLTFSDGTTVIADEDHQWLVTTRANRVAATCFEYDCVESNVLTTRQLYDNSEAGYGIPLMSAPAHHVNPVKNHYSSYTDGTLYVLASPLGDGSFPTSKDPHSKDLLASFGIELQDRGEGSFSLSDSSNLPQIAIEDYLYTDSKQRNNFLHGVMDAVGFISDSWKGEVGIAHHSQEILFNLLQLIHSLGYQTSFNDINKGVITFRPGKSRVFKSPQKHEKHFAAEEHSSPPTSTLYRFLQSIEPYHEPVSMHCITVDSPQSLYLCTSSYLVTHNTMGYAVPAILSGKRTVISTATKQLSEQIVTKDMKELQKALRKQKGETFTYSLLKGRENYVCKRKVDELQKLEASRPGEAGQQEALFSEIEEQSDIADASSGVKRAKEYQHLYSWIDRTRSGDRSEGPAVEDKVWQGVSATNIECVGKASCQFGDECFSELARSKARASDVVITNHAISALDLEAEESILLGDRDVYIFDELHELDNYLSNAWGTQITVKQLSDAFSLVKKTLPPDAKDKKSAETALRDGDAGVDALSDELETTPSGLFIENQIPVSLEASLKICLAAMTRLLILYPEKDLTSQESKVRRTLSSSCEALNKFLIHSEENVRWAKIPETERDKFAPSVNCAPLRIGPRLMNALHEKNAIMVGTSATITVAGKFDIPVHDLALDDYIDGKAATDYTAIDVGTPFNYDQQSILYIPNPSSFPSAEWKTRIEHRQAVDDTTLELVKASKGRALILLTKTERIKQVGDYLTKHLPKSIKVLQQGSGIPNPQLVEEFIADETSVLVATMGMWHGLDAPGNTCALVVIDKIPFKPFDDPLALARQKYADKMGRNGFMDVYVASANIMLAQGVGRLIRTMSDRGAVAILDTRLRTKSYGQAMLKSVPRMRSFDDLDVVRSALSRLFP